MTRDYIRVKDWMYVNREKRTKPEFIEGVASFINFVREHDRIQYGMILCPCSHCGNRLHRKEEDVELHIVKHGFIKDYTIWVYHGEIIAPNIADNEEEDNEENLFPEEEMEEMIEVAFGDSDLAEDDHPSRQEHVDEYEKYMKDAKRPIYENTKYSTLSWFVQLFQIKCLNKWSNKSFTMLLKFLKDSMPLGNNVPQSWHEAKRIIYKKKAHANKNDIPVKVVRYFPVIQRLQRLYKCKKTAVAMTWHDRAIPSEHGKMSHPRDSPAWKDFDKLHTIFSQDPRNIRLGLASDGFCPFSFNSNPHSSWPIIMMIYNLSLWLAMNQSYFLMPLLIDGSSSPGNNIDVYLRPLIDELQSLFVDGVETYDADKGETFTMRAALMWTINDFPTYGMLSGYSVHGYKACPYCHADTSST
ncbi:uncharacterized protein LOC109846247 [Asparagus officinalis]|uniref:uncharacterized protein LOC109846247 n=1 Tax=Asparagus officinalis TaxID=4686 RepID=UPI00098E2CEE|nr:uncharacterized protein LOC109846247 [Asparagus officinalis]